MTIKDQDLSKNRELLRNIVSHAVEQANFTIKNLAKRQTVSMLMECENCMSDLLPVVTMIAMEHEEFAEIQNQMTTVLEAIQQGNEFAEIEFSLGA